MKATDKDYEQRLQDNVQFKEVIEIIKEDIMEQHPEILNFASLFFEDNLRSQISKRRFAKLVKHYTKTDFKKDNINDLFIWMDQNHNGKLSYDEFKVFFDEDTNKRKDVNSIMNETKPHLKQLFNQIDTNNSNNIDCDEFYNFFMRIGHNISEKELKKHFASIDKDKDGYINFHEFCKLVEDKFAENIHSNETLHRQLREEFEKCNVWNNPEGISKGQFCQVLNNLGIKIAEELFESLVKDVDLDGSGVIDIDEFLSFMTSNRSEMDYFTRGAVDTIKLWSKITPLDNISTYKILP